MDHLCPGVDPTKCCCYNFTVTTTGMTGCNVDLYFSDQNQKDAECATSCAQPPGWTLLQSPTGDWNLNYYGPDGGQVTPTHSVVFPMCVKYGHGPVTITALAHGCKPDGQTGNEMPDLLMECEFAKSFDANTGCDQYIGVLAPVASRFRVLSLYPNPTKDAVTITYAIAKSVDVSISVYDNLGHLVATASAGSAGIGQYSITVNTTGLPPGSYECILRGANQFTFQRFEIAQ